MLRVADSGPLSSLLGDLAVPPTVLSLLLAHARAVESEGDRLGLVSVADLGAILTRHTADSLLFALVRSPGPGERWVDVGSGAGFPGFVLACCYPETSFTLVEPQSRRAGFLDLQATRLGLSNVVVAPVRAAGVADRFDVATARALAEPEAALGLLRIVAPEGARILAVGESASPLAGVQDVSVARAGVPGAARFFVEGSGT